MESLVDLRKSIGFSQLAFSELLGVSVASLRRWERGDSRPSALAAEKIHLVKKEIEAGHLDELLAKSIQHRSDNISDVPEHTFSSGSELHRAVLMPYVYNGPQDQITFYHQLISMQESAAASVDWKTYRSRLSIFQSIDGIPTAQYLLERPKANSKSWSADAGAHGWHRYVGRFPAQLIRAIINFFGLTEQDLLLDPFCGSGTTTVEARLLGIPAIGIEISPLSAMISRTKSCFPKNTAVLRKHISMLNTFYSDMQQKFLGGRCVSDYSYDDIIQRDGNSISAFSNYEKWFTKEALLGTSIIVEYIQHLNDAPFVKEAIATALSAKMRSIGNVDVDVVRAEYRKSPRENVDVLKLVTHHMLKMIKSIDLMLSSHAETILGEQSIKIIEGDCLSAELETGSISAIITSPPYGVESLSYLRTHLLSFRALEPVLGIDPYNFDGNVIGSEYLENVQVPTTQFEVMQVSSTCRIFFELLLHNPEPEPSEKRILMMIKFFEDMYRLIKKFDYWLRDHGKVAFIIGNKRLGTHMIPTDRIMIELFEHCGFRHISYIAHKLKTNNSNSKVPWQDRIIDNEYILFFEKGNRI